MRIVVVDQTTGRIVRDCGTDRALAEKIAARLPELEVRETAEAVDVIDAARTAGIVVMVSVG
jgi:hypothetical protein